jgi:ankyrin repeat protein
LELAVEFNLSLSVIDYMLKSGADPYLYGLSSAFYNAIFNDNSAVTRLLIDNGISVNRPVIGDTDYALSYAVAWGRFGIVKLLVDAGAKVNQLQMGFGEYDKTAAEIAYEWNEVDIYFFLKEHGAIYTAYGLRPPASSALAAPTGSTAPNMPILPAGPTSSGFNYSMESPLENGIYRLSGGKLDRMRITGVGKSGVISYNDPSGRTLHGIYTTAKNSLIITVSNKIFYYIITSTTSFAGNGESWYRSAP